MMAYYSILGFYSVEVIMHPFIQKIFLTFGYVGLHIPP